MTEMCEYEGLKNNKCLCQKGKKCVFEPVMCFKYIIVPCLLVKNGTVPGH